MRSKSCSGSRITPAVTNAIAVWNACPRPVRMLKACASAAAPASTANARQSSAFGIDSPASATPATMAAAASTAT